MVNIQEAENIFWPIVCKRDAKRGTMKESMTDSCEMTFSVDEWLKTIEMKKFVDNGMFLQMKTTPVICHKKNTSLQAKLVERSTNKFANDTQPLRKRSDFKQALSTLNRLHQEAGGDQLEPIPCWKYKQWRPASSSSSTWWRWQDSWWSA